VESIIYQPNNNIQNFLFIKLDSSAKVEVITANYVSHLERLILLHNKQDYYSVLGL